MSKRPERQSAQVVQANTALAERSVIGAILKNETLYWSVADTLKPEHFSVPLHGQIFSVIKDICEESKRLTLTLLLSRLPEQDEKGVAMDLTVHAMIKNAEDIQTPIDFAEQISEAANRRRLEQIGNALIKAAKNGEGAAVDIAGEAEMALLDVMHVSAPKRPRRIGEIAKGTAANAFKAKQEDFVPGLTWGLPSLDGLCGLILPGDLWFMLGAQGDGKSSLAMAPAMKAAEEGQPVLIAQLEMTDEQQAAREISKVAGMSVGAIREGAFDMFEGEKIEDAVRHLQKHSLYVLDIEEVTIRQLRAHCLGMKRTVGLSLLVIDQLDKLKSDNRHRDRFERTAELTRDLKNLAKVLRIPIICLAQRTRTSQRRDEPTPHIDDADAPTIERDADGVIAVWRTENWLRRRRPSGKDAHEMGEWQAKLEGSFGRAEAILLKHRSRKPFEQCVLRWRGETTQFEEL